MKRPRRAPGWLRVVGIVAIALIEFAASVTPLLSTRNSASRGASVDGEFQATSPAEPTARAPYQAAQLTGPQNATAVAWYNLTPNLPTPPVFYGTFAFDPAWNATVLVTPFNDTHPEDSQPVATWILRNYTWQNVTASVGSPVDSAEQSYLDYDTNTGGLFLLGTNETGFSMWEISNGTWSAIPVVPGDHPAWSAMPAVYDAAAGAVVWIGGGGVGNETVWEFANDSWTNDSSSAGAGPPGTQDAGVTYDSGTGCLVLFGGSNDTSYLNQTWELCHGKWQQVHSTLTPPAPVSGIGRLVYDPELGGDLLADYYLNLSDFEYQAAWYLLDSGNWSLFPSAETLPITVLLESGPGTAVSSLVYNPDWAGVLEFGGGVYSESSDSIGACCRQTWVLAASIPPFPSVVPGWNPTEVGETVPIGTSVDGGTAPFEYAYSGLPSGCVGANTASLDCTPTKPGNYSISVEVTDATGRRGTSTFVLQVVPRVQVEVRVEPTAIDLGQTANLTVNVTGGAPPYNVTFEGLPPGCPASNRTSFTCTPTRAGTFVVNASVGTPIGPGNRSTAVLQVNAQLALVSFSTSAPEADPGIVVRLQAEVTGGTPPDRFVYSGLPSGCASSNLSAIGCATNETGTFSVEVGVRDSTGESAYGDLNWTVVPPPSVGNLTISPSIPVAGEPTHLVLLESHGVPPFSVEWTGLTSAPTRSELSLNWTPESPGRYLVIANLLDADGRNSTGAFQILVTALPNSASVISWEWPAVFGGVAAAAIALLWVAGRRRPVPSDGGPERQAEPAIETGHDDEASAP